MRCVQWIGWVQYNGCAVHHMASGVCSVWCVQCMGWAVEGVCRGGCVQSMGCAVYGGAVAVHHHVSTVSCVWRVVCAVYDVCSAWCVQGRVCEV